MRILVVGGHTREIGKTSLVVDIILAFPETPWTAVKITQYGHGVCATNGENCGCAPNEHSVALDEEQNARGDSDTSRFLAAGARHSLWLRTKQGRLAEGLPPLREALDKSAGPSGDVIVESNSLLGLLRPQLYVVVVNPKRDDFKDSARVHLDRADAFILRETLRPGEPASRLLGSFSAVPKFLQPLEDPLPSEFRDWLLSHFFAVSIGTV